MALLRYIHKLLTEKAIAKQKDNGLWGASKKHKSAQTVNI